MTLATDHLHRLHVPFETLSHARAYSSIDEARALGIAAGEVAKVIVLDTKAGHVLAVLPGSKRLDMHKVRDVLEDEHVKLASEEEIERDYPNYEPGALPPLGGLLATPMIMDEELAGHDTIVFPDGSQTESVKMKTSDLLRIERSAIEDVSSERDTFDEDWME